MSVEAGEAADMVSETPFKVALSYVTWPGLLAICMAITAVGMAHDHAVIGFNAAYVLLGVSLFVLERWMPYERRWLQSDGQTFADIAHTLLNKGMVQAVAVVITTYGIAVAVDPEPSSFWPVHWPQWAQIVLAMVIAEFGLYWAHRLAHEWPKLWHFHAVHHSVKRLWIINTGRFHFVDTAVSVALSQPLLYLAGAPLDMFMWVGALTAFTGLLTHTNTQMRCGWLNWIFNTPELHRWHHQPNGVEGNTNYGEVLIWWDMVFGTRYLPAGLEPPRGIGIKEDMPESFPAQLAYPFRALKEGRGRLL